MSENQKDTLSSLRSHIFKSSADLKITVEMPEYLNGQKELSNEIGYYDLYGNDNKVNLPDVFALIDWIVTGIEW